MAIVQHNPALNSVKCTVLGRPLLAVLTENRKEANHFGRPISPLSPGLGAANGPSVAKLQPSPVRHVLTPLPLPRQGSGIGIWGST